jgi:carbon storage regulator
MLVVTRRVGDAIAIGDRIVVRIVDVQGSRVQLGIDAPKDVRIESIEGPRRPEPPRK